MGRFIMLVGLPASGKSTLAKSYEEQGYKIHSSDKLREELLGNINDQDSNEIIFKALHQRMVIDMELGHNIVYDATNLNIKKRRFFMQSISKFDYVKIAMVMATPYEVCIERDADRERKVGHRVIDRMYKSFNFPLEQEGFDRVEIRYNVEGDVGLTHYEDKGYSLGKQKEFLCTVSQNNSNHTLTIGGHCRKVFSILARQPVQLELHYAGLLHDFGKLKTMSFKNTKGEYTNQAHYYSHENVSAYDAMFYVFGRGVDTGLVCQLIQYHMRPHGLTTDKSVNKFKKFVGDDFFNTLMILHEADKEAR